jgi:hypothetical protein
MIKPKNNAENFDKCICRECSLYYECNRKNGEMTFCARTPSSCEMDEARLCICPKCPVYSENKLSGAYFCIREIK